MEAGNPLETQHSALFEALAPIASIEVRRLGCREADAAQVAGGY
jgi:hypothetical protein